MSNYNKKNELSIIGVIPIFIGICLLAWFFFLPGEITYKWNILSQYLEKKREVLLFSIGIISFNIALVTLLIITITGFGQLGSRIKRYRIKSGPSNTRFNILTALASLLSGFLAWNILDPFASLLLFPSVVPFYQIKIFVFILKYSFICSFGICVNLFITQFPKLVWRTRENTLPPFPNSTNTLVLGVVNEI